MLQFYLLSVLFNLISGYALAFDYEAKGDSLDGFRVLFRDETFRLLLGVLTFFTGFLKIVSAIRGDIPVIGDLFPATAGLLAGFSLILEYYKIRAILLKETSDKLDLIFVKNRKWLGMAATVSAIAHFLFPTVLFL